MKLLPFAVIMTLSSFACNAEPQNNAKCDNARLIGVSYVPKICSAQRLAENFCTCITFEGTVCSGPCLGGKPAGCACK